VAGGASSHPRDQPDGAAAPDVRGERDRPLGFRRTGIDERLEQTRVEVASLLDQLSRQAPAPRSGTVSLPRMVAVDLLTGLADLLDHEISRIRLDDALDRGFLVPGDDEEASEVHGKDVPDGMRRASSLAGTERRCCRRP